MNFLSSLVNSIRPQSFIERAARLLPQRNHVRAATLVVLSALLLFYAYQAVDLYRNARQIVTLSQQAQPLLIARDWQQARVVLGSVQQNMDELEQSLDRLFPITVIPPISREASALRNVLAAGNITIDNAQDVLDWAAAVPILGNADTAFETLTDADKTQLLKALDESAFFLKSRQEQTDLAVLFLRQARLQSRLSVLVKNIDKVLSRLARGQQVFRTIQPWLAELPSIAGYPKEKTYLVLLQNNTELRPTGGFIGTYGTITIKNGSVAGFMTDNVYNLDEPAKAYLAKIPPDPIKQYLKQSQWFFRDVNWDPDFPSTAQNAIQFYHDERGPVKTFDGVIAMTPDVVQDLLNIAGPIEVDGKTFTAENLVDLLAYHVELGFKEEGITIYNRKQIIDDVAQELQSRLFTLSFSQMRQLAPLVLSAFSQRQLLVYFSDSDTQSLAESLSWGGRVLPAEQDFLHAVDANLGSLKSDPAINRTIRYTVAPDAMGNMTATAAITYEHTGNFDWKTTRYRTYTRLYVPRGSRLLSAEGNEETITITDEHGKSVFGTFISIEPQHSETLSFTYLLPPSVIKNDSYGLLVQKQAGTRAHELLLDITVPFAIHTASGEPSVQQAGKRSAAGTLQLDQDKEILIK